MSREYLEDSPLMGKNSFFITNLDHKYGSGTHWVALARRNKNITYFDSYGIGPGEDVQNYINRHKDIDFYVNNHQYQSNKNNIDYAKSQICGSSCLDFIEMFYRPKRVQR